MGAALAVCLVTGALAFWWGRPAPAMPALAAPVPAAPSVPHPVASAPVTAGGAAAGARSQASPLGPEALAAAAERGEPAAMRVYADMHMRCIFSMGKEGWSSATFWQTVDGRANVLPADQAAYLRAAAQRLHDHCARLGQGLDRRGFALQYRVWMEEAAEAGDLAARIRMGWRPGQPKPDPVADSALMDEILASGDGYAMLEAMRLMYRARNGLPGYEGQDFGVPTMAAFTLLACEHGVDCGAGSPTMDSLCLDSGNCSGQGIDTVVFESDPDPAFEDQVQQRKAELEALISAHRGR